jgi:polyisoprenoid-binding protein YceI
VTFLEQVKSITDNKNVLIVLYGSSERSMDAITAAEKLQAEGYQQMMILEGGLDTWRSLGYPLEGESMDVATDLQTHLVLPDGKYHIDTDESIIEWAGRNPNTKHFGTVRISSGQIQIENNIITGIAKIDMNSIENINLEGDELQPVLVSHLKSDDFFLVKVFPTAKFTINGGRLAETPYLSSPNYELDGTLELRGVKADVSFAATIAATEDNGLVAEAHFDIDRTRWNVIYGSTRFFEHLGMHLVFDLVSFQVKVMARQ